MNAGDLRQKFDGKSWVILLVTVAVLLIIFSFYKKGGRVVRTAEVQPSPPLESGSKERPEELELMVGRYVLMPEYEKTDEAGNTTAKEGIKLYAEEKYEEAKEFLEKAAEEGHSDAKALLGKMYVFGHGVSKDVKRGIDYLEDAAEHGSSYAAAELGALYVEGRHGVEKAVDKGLNFIRKSIEGSHYYGHLAMARLYEVGEGVEQSTEQAIEHLKAAGERGYKYAADEIDKLRGKI